MFRGAGHSGQGLIVATNSCPWIMSKGNDFQATLDMREFLLLTGGIRREVECIGVEILPVTSIIAIHHPTYGLAESRHTDLIYAQENEIGILRSWPKCIDIDLGHLRPTYAVERPALGSIWQLCVLDAPHEPRRSHFLNSAVLIRFLEAAGNVVEAPATSQPHARPRKDAWLRLRCLFDDVLSKSRQRP